MNRGKGQWIFALIVGLLVAVAAHRWITDPEPRMERQLEESAVAGTRTQLGDLLAAANLEFVDPLMPNRRVGKSYVYRLGEGWEVSGYYRRNADDSWHPFLMQLDSAMALTQLKVQDPALADLAASEPMLELVQ